MDSQQTFALNDILNDICNPDRPRNRMYVVTGIAGAGKTYHSFHFGKVEVKLGCRVLVNMNYGDLACNGDLGTVVSFSFENLERECYGRSNRKAFKT